MFENVYYTVEPIINYLTKDINIACEVDFKVIRIYIPSKEADIPLEIHDTVMVDVMDETEEVIMKTLPNTSKLIKL